MANVVTIQTLQDGPRNVKVKLVGVLDTTGEIAATTLINPALLGPIDNATGQLATKLAIKRITYDVEATITVHLLWDATADVTAVTLNGFGEMCFGDTQFLQNNAGAGVTGIINYSTQADPEPSATNVLSFTVILDLVKQV